MTQAEFQKTRWGKGMRALYRGEIYLIAQVDFEEQLIGMVSEQYESDPNEVMSWARCENVELMNYQIPQS
jgi:hypothetical protein